MNNPANDRIRHICNVLDITLKAFSETLEISEGTIKSMFNRGTNPSFEFLEKVANAYPDLDANWLITGKGDMYKSNEAGRDNNIVEGKNNKQYVQSGTSYGMVGENSGNYLQIGDTGNLKKIMKDGEVSIEFAQSVEIIQQKNDFLEQRVKDLEDLLEAKGIIIEGKDSIISSKEELIAMLKSK